MTWQVKPLGEVCETLSGGTPSRARPEYFGGAIPWVKSGDLTDDIVSSSEECITELGIQNSNAKLLPEGTLLLAMYGATVGKLGVLSMQAATNQAVCAITPRADIDRGFLFYFLLSKRKELIRKSIGGAQPNISQRIVRDLLLPIPPFGEQRRIADVLDRGVGISRLRALARQKAADILRALFTDAFGDPVTNPKGWNVVALGEVIDSADYGTSKKANELGAGVPVLRMGNVDYAGALDLADLKYVELPSDQLAAQRLQNGDILFNRTNSKDLVGKTALWDVAIKEAVAASYFIRVRVDAAKARPFYVWAYMNTPHMKRVLFDTARGAIGQANINTRELRTFPIPLPDLATQDRFEARCRDVQSIVAQQARAQVAADATFQSLLARTFAVPA